MNGKLILEAVGSWMIPGFGFFMRGCRIRALVLFVIIEGTFFLGLVFTGGVTPPVLDASGGGIISFLTFIIQLGNGLSGFLSFGASLWSANMKAQGLIPSPLVVFFAGYPPKALFDQASMYLLVSGAMNYFAVTNFYDRYKTKDKKS
ncbi:hypothetical protein JW926_06720 [Candidatus Sumerlaeota bacterium]|nr:hypothetical protein [Candidatus Sumerlaeota bacterium]